MFLAGVSGGSAVEGSSDAAALRAGTFELLAASEMRPALLQALKFALAVLAERDSVAGWNYPARFHAALLWAHRHADSLYGLWTFLLERRYLRRRSASFAEDFYGLRRVSTSSASDAIGAAHSRGIGSVLGAALSSRQALISLGQLVFLPAMHEYGDRLYARHLRNHGTRPVWASLMGNNGDAEDLRAAERPSQATSARVPHSWKRRLLPLFVRIWPFINFANESTTLAFMLAYMYGRTDYFSPLQYAARVRIRRQTSEEAGLEAPSPSMIGKPQTRDRIRSMHQRSTKLNRWTPLRFLIMLWRGTGAALEQTKYVLPLVVFTIRFLEWWHNEAHMQDVFRAAALSAGVPPPPAPPILPQRTKIDRKTDTASNARATEDLEKEALPSASDVVLPDDPNLCPLCRRTRTNPAASVSGFVMCYPCLFAHVEEFKRCPVSLLPMEITDIRKIYE